MNLRLLAIYLAWVGFLGIQRVAEAQVVIKVQLAIRNTRNTGVQSTLSSLPPYELHAALTHAGRKAPEPLLLRFDPALDSPESLAQRLLEQLRQQITTQRKGVQKTLRQSPEYAFLLAENVPQRDAFLRSATQEIARLSSVTSVPLTPPILAQLQTTGNRLSVLYTTERSIPGGAFPRRLRLTIHDRGANAPYSGQRRYLLCVSYNTGQGEFVGPTTLGGCGSERQRVTTTVELDELTSREMFVGQTMTALAPASLWRVDGNGANFYRDLEAEQADLAQKRADVVVGTLAARAATAAYDVAAAVFPPPANLTTLRDSQSQANSLLNAAMAAESEATTTVATVQAKTRTAVNEAADHHDILGTGADEQTALQSLLTDVFIDYTKQQTASAAAPKAGVVEIQGTLAVRGKADGLPYTTFYPDSVQLVVEDGNVEELKVNGRLADGQPILFETYAPIGISSDHDLQRTWPRQQLWSQLTPAAATEPVFIRLTDLLRYTPNVGANGKDRSPADGTYIIHPTDGLAHRTLPRLATTKILQARVYSDVVGLNGYKPNGLLQVEVDRKLEWGTPWGKKWRTAQFRWPGYFVPLIAATKIEQSNRYLPLERVPGNALLYHVNTIDLLRYTNLRVGGDFNLGGLRLAAIKSDLFLDGSVYLNRVDIRDSVRRPNTAKLVRVDSTLNVAMYGIGLKTRFRPDSRYGVQSRIGFYRYVLLNDYDQDYKLLIQQTPNITGLNPDAHTQFAKYIYQGVMQYELLAWATLSENSRLFFRTQFSHLLYQSNHTYFQLQVGYQFDVFTTTRDNKDKVKTLFP